MDGWMDGWLERGMSKKSCVGNLVLQISQFEGQRGQYLTLYFVEICFIMAGGLIVRRRSPGRWGQGQRYARPRRKSAKSSALFFRFQIRLLNVIKKTNRGARVRNGVSGIILTWRWSFPLLSGFSIQLLLATPHFLIKGCVVFKKKGI